MAGQRKRTDRFAARRRSAARRTRTRTALDALLVTRPEDVGYLSGFTGEDSWLVIGTGSLAVLITDGRYVEQARAECPSMAIHLRSGAMSKALAAVTSEHGLTGLAFQADHLTVRVRDVLADRLEGVALEPISGVVPGLRQQKDDAEVQAIRKAVKVAEQAFQSLLDEGAGVFVGRTEREVAADLNYRMVCRGATKPSFETIVAAGPHGSLPHYRPADTVIRPDDAVLIDWGALVEGYCSDLTRVVFTGRIPPKLAEVYDVVLRAQKAAIRAIRPRLSCDGTDATARRVIEQAGYGQSFLHGLGHGIGRQIHEAPTVGRGRKDRLRSGMVVTVEPGIYLPGVGGVRIEDDVLVTSQGHRRLSSLPTSIEAMTLGPGR